MKLIIDILALILSAVCIMLGIEIMPVHPMWLIGVTFICGGFIGGMGTCNLIEKGWKQNED